MRFPTFRLPASPTGHGRLQSLRTFFASRLSLVSIRNYTILRLKLITQIEPVSIVDRFAVCLGLQFREARIVAQSAPCDFRRSACLFPPQAAAGSSPTPLLRFALNKDFRMQTAYPASPHKGQLSTRKPPFVSFDCPHPIPMHASRSSGFSGRYFAGIVMSLVPHVASAKSTPAACAVIASYTLSPT